MIDRDKMKISTCLSNYLETGGFLAWFATHTDLVSGMLEIFTQILSIVSFLLVIIINIPKVKKILFKEKSK